MRKLLILSLFVFSSCASLIRDPDYERFLAYKQELYDAVARKELSPIQASTLENEAYNQYMMIRNQKQQLQTQQNYLFSALAQQPQQSSGTTIYSRPRVVCTNCN